VDPSRALRLARLLAFQGFEVKRAEDTFKIGTRTVPAGAFIVPVAQPASRLLRNLMEPQIAQPDSFVKEQDRRRKKRLNDQIYDTPAWSLPLAFDVDVVATDKASVVKTTAVPADDLGWLLLNETPRESSPTTRETASMGGGGGGASSATAGSGAASVGVPV